MSDGIKAMYEDLEEEARQAHIRKLEALGYRKISFMLEDLSMLFDGFKYEELSLPKWGHSRLERIHSKIKELT